MIRSSARRLLSIPLRSRAPRVPSRPHLLRLERHPNTLSPTSTRHFSSSTIASAGQVKEFKLADIGEGITECEIVKWLVKPGDTISEFDPVAEVQSDKASVEITSPYSGTIRSIAGEVGDMLKVGATLCQVELEGTEESGSTSSPSHSTSIGDKPTALSTTTTKQFKLADIGEGITECEVVKWLVQPGDQIEEFDPIVEVTSDKASVEITSPFFGTIESLAGGVGDMLKVGSTLCEIQVESSSPSREEETSIASEASLTSATTSTTSTAVPHPVRPDPRLGSASVLATPATRRFARELQVDITKVTPTGRDGRVTKGDVLEHSKKEQGDSQPFIPFERPPISSSTSSPSQPRAEALPQPASPVSTLASEPMSLSPTRRAMYRAMTASLEIPHFAYSETIDVTLLERLRLSLNSHIPLDYRKTRTPKDRLALDRVRQWKPENELRSVVEEPAKFDRMTLLPLLVKALSTALHAHPLFTCTLSPQSSSPSSEPTLVRRSSHDISVAVSSPSPSGGLFTPVLRSIDTQSIYSVASNLSHLQSFVSSSSSSSSAASSIPKFPPRFQGSGTITLSNIGAIGGKTTHPVIPPTGQLAIGAMGRVRVEPRFASGTEQERAKRVAKGEEVDLTGAWKIEPRLVMDVTFSADHRVVEGVELARLVETWKEIIEDPTRLLA